MGTNDQQNQPVETLLERVAVLVKARTSRTAPHLLAEVLQREIVTAGITDDTRLFDEGTLQRKTGLSRTVIREAVRLLESRGLVEVRVGARGGIYVQNSNYKALHNAIDILISRYIPEPIKVLEARQEMETLCAKLAARHATESDIRTLRDSLRSQEQSENNPAAFLEENIRFHLAVAESIRNPVLASVTHSLRDIVHSTTMGYSYSPDALRGALVAHQRLVQAIAARDEIAAARIMEHHMDAVAAHLRHTGQLKT